jgi:hypothetical protein
MLQNQLMNVTRHVFKTNKFFLRSVKKKRKWININKTKKTNKQLRKLCIDPICTKKKG